ncbi:MAG: DUF5723 family protein [Cytophagaceae bacterium]
MKRYLLLTLFTAFSSMTFGQSEYSVYTAAGKGVATTFVTDYQAIGINPANLGFKRTYDTKHVTFGLMEFGVSTYSEALSKSTFKKSISTFSSADFTYQQKIEAAQNFANKALSINADVNWFGISYQNDKIGGFAFGIRESFRYYSKFSQSTSDILFRGYGASYFDSLQLGNGTYVANNQANYEANQGNITSGKTNNPLTMATIFNGSKIQMLYYREYNLSYGKEFEVNEDVQISGGIGLKYLQGFGMINASSDGQTLTAYGAFSPQLGIDFGSASKTNPSADTTSGGLLPKTAGHGLGMDLGLNAVLFENLKIGVAVTNIGSITYDVNVYTMKNDTLASLTNPGFQNYNIFSQFGNFTSGSGLFRWEGKEKIKVNLPTMVRAGASYKLGEKAEVGVDFVIPATVSPGNFQSMVWSVGGDFKPFRWLKLSGGMIHGGNYASRVNIPLGFSFIAGENGTWEMGVSSRDAVTWFRSNGPVLSFAMGFLRFRI